jgi:hypothetical protein
MEINFRWVGRNRKFGDITINEGLTTSALLSGNYQSFFSESNRRKDGNCEFLSEDLFSGMLDINSKGVYEGDIIIVMKLKMMEVLKCQNIRLYMKTSDLQLLA